MRVEDISEIEMSMVSSGLAVGHSFQHPQTPSGTSYAGNPGKTATQLSRFRQEYTSRPSQVKNDVEKECPPRARKKLYWLNSNQKVFLVENKSTIEVRCDKKLGKLLREKYESVMESRYFGRGGIEIVTAGKQLSDTEIEDLVRLSYNLTKEME